ncbi:MAG: SUMF1/EgtB/PvdO family nonheme iron enzyme [Chthonomonadales bacterium]|nr:SUMF1/EgtB/PvdO family nonheme iron enzyme [Chthonomonadales bacterium]
MQKPAKSPRVFISYSHQDAAILDSLKVHLRAYEWCDAVSVWDDQRLLPGQDWRAEIKNAIQAADVAVLLVSPHFLASRFIRDNELPPLLAGKHVLWVAVSHCAYGTTPIADYQCVHDPRKPLKGLSVVQRDGVFLSLCQAIVARAAAKPDGSGGPPHPDDSELAGNARPAEVPARIQSLGLELIFIPAGRFQMGDDLRWEETGAYWIGKYPVTVAQYRRFCAETGREMPPAPDWGWMDNHPIVNVTWFDARDFCAWAGGRLPTEKEWEKAARWDEAKKHSRVYPWGDEWEPDKYHSVTMTGMDLGSTAPVGSHPSGVSPYGCHDMVGNVQEWCEDGLDERDEPLDALSSVETLARVAVRATRGASYAESDSRICSAAYDFWLHPALRFFFIGCRYVLPDDVC